MPVERADLQTIADAVAFHDLRLDQMMHKYAMAASRERSREYPDDVIAATREAARYALVVVKFLVDQLAESAGIEPVVGDPENA